MKRLILTLLLAGLTAPAALNAQKAYRENGKVILDLTPASGMPVGAATNVSKTAVYASAIPSNSSQIANNSPAGSLNETAYQKLEIAQSDYNAGSDWASAFTGCRGWTHNGSSDWRLPTDRELALIYLFRPALESLGVAAFVPGRYWNSNETGDTTAAYDDFNSSLVISSFSKNSSYKVRCVREVTP